jgi:hypothetical protein
MESKTQQHLAAERRTQQSRRRVSDAALYSLDGAALVGHVKAAVARAVQRSPHRASEWERDALVQVVTVSALRGGSLAPTWQGKRTAPRRALDVLAWLDYAERYPLSAKRADQQRLARGAGTRAHLERVTADRIADSRSWRDVASGYRTRAGNTVPTVSDDALAERPAEGWLAAERSGESLPESSRALAEAVAAALGGTEREQRAMSVALRASLPTHDGEPLNLLMLSSELGLSHGSTRNLASDGARLLRTREPSGAALAELVRDVAAAIGLAPPSRALRALLTGKPGPLYPSAMAAALAVERLAKPYRPSGARSMPEREPRTCGEPSESGAQGAVYAPTVHVRRMAADHRSVHLERSSAGIAELSEQEADALWLRATAPMSTDGEQG